MLTLEKSNLKLISGTIVSKEDHLPLPGVSIVNKRTRIETQSDFDGIYKLSCKTGDEIEFSFIGLETQRLSVTKDSIYDIAMKEDFCQDNAYLVLGFPSYNWDGYYKRKCRQKERKAARIEKVKKIKNGEIKRSFVGRILYTLSYPFRSRD
ncbi:MAG: carboxypeptidase-like regulatory domain-containing protein [Psychroserpens sp.]|nr:carboxypeptidase-like regulatory domain-containing protein [Psychroserpens sp.]